MTEPLPHSRACGIRKHEHGTDCSSNCPTCHGRPFAAVEPRTPEENETFNAVQVVSNHAHWLEDLVDWMLYSKGRDNPELRNKAHALRRELEAWAAEGAPNKPESPIDIGPETYATIEPVVPTGTTNQ